MLLRTPKDRIKPRLLDAALLLCRLALGFYFLLNGFVRVTMELRAGPGTFRHGAFRTLEPAFLPEAVGSAMGYALPWVETLLGTLLLLGFFGTLTALCLAALLAVALAGRITAHGLDGVAGHPPPFTPDYPLLTLCLLLAITGPGRISLDRLSSRKKTR